MADQLNEYDRMFMQVALTLAKKGAGKTNINPLVGAVIVNNGRIVGHGFHQKRGSAHAEIIALTEAGSRAKNATLYVNLEPCCYQGITPPCTTAILKAQIRRVVIGMLDPNPLVNGKGIKILKKHNIEVTTNVLSHQAKQCNKVYEKFIKNKLPYVILKIAISANNKVAGFNKKYITGLPALRFVHALRNKMSAVLVGINTVINDNPYLTTRLCGDHNPARIVIDPQLKIPMNANFLEQNAARYIITNHNNKSKKIKKLTDLGINFIYLEDAYFQIDKILKMLAEFNIDSILVEGGKRVFTDFFNNEYYDELYLFKSPEYIPSGLSLSNEMVQKILSLAIKSELIGKDLLYYVHRHN